MLERVPLFSGGIPVQRRGGGDGGRQALVYDPPPGGWHPQRYQQEIEMLPPHALARDNLARLSSIQLRLVGKCARLRRFSGQTGHKGLSSLELLKKYWRYLEIPADAGIPSDEYGLGMGVYKVTYPELEEPDHEDMLMHRCAKGKTFKHESVLENSKDLDDLVDHDLSGDERTDIKDTIAKHLAQKKLEHLEAKVGVAVALGAQKKKSKAKPPLYDMAAELVTTEYALTLFPKRPGLRLRKDTELHMRWHAYYPRVEWPRYSTKVFRGLGEKGALLHVLREVWGWHTALTREECPWDLSAELDADGPH